MPPSPLSERLADAARAMEGARYHESTMDTAVGLGLQLVPGAEEAGISLVRRKEIDSPATTSQLVNRIDQLQYEHDEGPCLDAIRESEVVASCDVSQDARWPSWGPAASEETGLRSMLCFRLFTHDDTYGALNFYSRQADAFDDVAQENGLALAAHAAIAVAAVQEIDHLKVGMDGRTVVGQAQGILMERFDIDSDRAFTVLTRVSSHSNRKLREIAAEIVSTRRLPGVAGP